MEVKVKVNKKVGKIIRSKQKSSKDKYNNFLEELYFTPNGGEYYTKYHGERLKDVEKEYGVNFEIHSIEIEERLRLVYELKTCMEGILICITDLDNHKYRGEPYVELT